MTYYSEKLSNELFCPIDKINNVIVIFSKKYSELKKKQMDKENNENRYSYLKTYPPTKIYHDLKNGNFENHLQEDNFVRKSEKYWILLKDLPEIMFVIMKKLPLFLFDKTNTNLIQETTSVYLDSDDLISYHNRINKIEGAKLIRLRWYGDIKNSENIFIEQKVHHEGWTVENSTKERVSVDKNKIDDIFKNANCDTYDNDLVKEIKNTINNLSLKPYLITQYLRFAFQDENNDFIRISIDTNLRMIKKNGNVCDWNHYESVTSSNDIHFFPYAVMEIKLRDPFIDNKPIWLKELLNMKELIPSENFSKYQHGCSLLHYDKIKIIPCWIKNSDVFMYKGEVVESVNQIQRISATIEETEKTIPKIRLDPRMILSNEQNLFRWLSFVLIFYKLLVKKSFFHNLIVLSGSFVSLFCGFYLYITRLKKLETGQIDDFKDKYCLYGIGVYIAILLLNQSISLFMSLL